MYGSLDTECVTQHCILNLYPVWNIVSHLAMVETFYMYKRCMFHEMSSFNKLTLITCQGHSNGVGGSLSKYAAFLCQCQFKGEK